MTPKYKLVPVEPTEVMHNIALGYLNKCGTSFNIRELYKVMLAVAPSPSPPHDPYKALEVAREALNKLDSPHVDPLHRLIAHQALNQINQVLGDKHD